MKASPTARNHPTLPRPIPITEHVWPEGTVPVVSICCTAYNHARFIRDCLDGFLMQETTFPVEILIHDDASMDGTSGIIREYERSYPHLVKPIYQTENQYSRGIKPSQHFNYPRVKGDFIAHCEGDDYWTSSQKLAIQVEFLKKNTAASFCFHQSVVLDDKTGHTRLFSDCPISRWYNVVDLTQRNFIPTASVVYRNVEVAFSDYSKKFPAGDWLRHFLHAERGDFYYFSEPMSVYRLHEGGIWSSLGHDDMVMKGIRVMELLDDASSYKYHEHFLKGINERKKTLRGRNRKGRFSGFLKGFLSRWAG